MDADDDEAFLYGGGDETATAAPAGNEGPTLGNGFAGVHAEAVADNGDEMDEDEESDDDLEIILDTEGAAPPPASIRRPLLPPPRPTPARSETPQKAPAPTGEHTPLDRAPSALPSISLDPSGSPAPDSAPTPAPTGLEVPVVGLVPHGSLTPLPPAETRPSIDVDAVAKDANGNDLFDLDIDSLEDKPWRRPGANMADYFNYGMNEPAWKNYAMKQRRTRAEESAEKNPFAAFGGGNVAEAWQQLAPEFKAVMMATIMGYQPGMGPPPGGMQGMMGMMGMGGMQGMQGMGGMGGYGMQQGMGGYGGGPSMEMGYGGGQQMDMGYGGQKPYDQGPKGAEGEGDATLPNGAAGEEAPVEGDEGGDAFAAMAGRGGRGVVRGRGAVRGATRGRGVARGGMVAGGMVAGGIAGMGADAVPIPRAPSPLPPGVPTGPRNPGPAPARRDRSGYHDKDRQDRAGNEGLDYGAGSGKDLSPVRRRESGSRARSSAPAEEERRERYSDRRRREDREDERREDRRDEERREDRWEEERREEKESTKKEERKRGVDELFPDRAPLPVKAEEDSQPLVVGLKIRGSTRLDKKVDEVVEEPVTSKSRRETSVSASIEQDEGRRSSRRDRDEGRKSRRGEDDDRSRRSSRRDDEDKGRRSGRGSGEDEVGRTRRSHREDEEPERKRSKVGRDEDEDEGRRSRDEPREASEGGSSRGGRRHHWSPEPEDVPSRGSGRHDDRKRKADEVAGDDPDRRRRSRK